MYRAAVASGLEVGVDGAVTGWDDVAAAATLTPPLTTVRQPMRDLGGVAAAQLFTHMNGDTTEGAVLPTSVVRSSCRCLEDEST